MAESALGYLLNKLDAFTHEEWRLLRDVHQGIEDVRRELQQMTAFLRVADANQHRDQQLQAWVTQVRQVSYDIEDVLDEYLRLRFHRPGGRLIRILFSVKKLNYRHKIAADIQSIKSRVIKIWESHGRYLLPNPQSQDQASYLSSPPSTPVWHDPRGDALLRPEEDPVGMDKPKAELLQLLGDIGGGGSGLKVVSIVGMGGLGKTTLATKVYNEVKPHFELCAKINVSQSFDEKGVLKQLIRQACNCKGMNEEERRKVESTMDKDDADLKEVVLDLMRPKRYLILLDDVWNINAWNTLKIVFPDNQCCGSRILLTTRNRDVAATAGNGKFYEMSTLSSEDSWSLFCKKSFWGNPCPSHLETVSQRIVKRCGGLPLAIVAISGVLAIRDTGNVDEWEKIDRSMQAELESNDGFQSVMKVLWMSYSDLPYYLKNCFLYLSAFPEDYLIKRMTLIRLWVADGFVMRNQNLTGEEVAESYLNELVGRNLVQVGETTRDGRLASVRMHDMLRDIALKKSKNEGFLEVADGETASTAWERKIRRLSIQSNKINDIKMDKRLSKLRTFLMWEEWDPWSGVSVQSLLWGNCPLLRVLDLGGCALDKFPNKIVELYHLRYLSLRDTQVDAVPNSIGKLQNLETLNLKGTPVRELPIGISKLHQLRHLLVYRKEYIDVDYERLGFKAPRGIGGLQCVQKLCFIEMTGEANEQRIKEIGRLTQLRKLGLRSIRGEDGKALCSALNRLTNLRSLHLALAQSGEVTIDLDGKALCSALNGLTNLRSLHLCGPCGSLPQWISTLQNLVVLFLRDTKLKDDQLESLKALPTLRVLILVRCYEGETLCFTAGGFPRLKNLELVELAALERVEFEKGSLPSLEQLTIRSCRSLKGDPAGMQFLAQLKRFDSRENVVVLYTQVTELRRNKRVKRKPRRLGLGLNVASLKGGG